MKIDRMFYEKFEERGARKRLHRRQRRGRPVGSRHRLCEQGGLRQARRVLLAREAAQGRRRGSPHLTLREILEKIFGLIPRFKSKDELLEEEFAKFVADYKPEEAEAHSRDQDLLQGLRHEQPGAPHHRDQANSPTSGNNPVFSTERFQGGAARNTAMIIPDYIKDYVSLNQFASLGNLMLDTDTKRRIDTARDILVGKVPDPKSQVEQITIALIYKFMDDMDAEAEETRREAEILHRRFARYGWAKLMRSGLGRPRDARASTPKASPRCRRTPASRRSSATFSRTPICLIAIPRR